MGVPVTRQMKEERKVGNPRPRWRLLAGTLMKKTGKWEQDEGVVNGIRKGDHDQIDEKCLCR